MKRPLSRRQENIVRRLFDEDQRQRLANSPSLDEDDAVRFGLASMLAGQKRQSFDGATAYRIGMMLHHGDAPRLARRMAARSLGRHPTALWLVSAVNDRELVRRGLPQRSGTQYRIDPQTGEWRLIGS